jgi:hypothetical protein
MGGKIYGNSPLGMLFDPLDLWGEQAKADKKEEKKADQKLEAKIAQEKADEAANSKAIASSAPDPLADADADLFKRNALQGKTTKVSSQLGVL